RSGRSRGRSHSYSKTQFAFVSSYVAAALSIGAGLRLGTSRFIAATFFQPAGELWASPIEASGPPVPVVPRGIIAATQRKRHPPCPALPHFELSAWAEDLMAPPRASARQRARRPS
ncbi:MAG TPA: hypothetical protein VH080_02920, partial [Gemmatimonadaceae bacterium]|nr:hypothetical protein [Gemmatimonadaceae bacterium]